MKTKTLFFIICVLFASAVNAQSDYSSYLQKATEKLEAGECEAAWKYYNVYKELSHQSLSSFEALLSDCKKEYYALGEKMLVNGETYIVVYIRDYGKHGYAVLDKGWHSVNYYGNTISQKKIPTIEELKLIYANRDAIGLFSKYWSCTKSGSCTSGRSTYKTIDFSTGKEIAECENEQNGGIILMIHRF